MALMKDDALHALPARAVLLKGDWDYRIRNITKKQLKELNYTKLVDFFRYQTEEFAAGEFWGKTMRAACLACEYTGDSELKELLDRTVDDLLSIQGEDGCLSVHPTSKQPYKADLWERKYVLLGLGQYYEMTQDDKALKGMIRLADYTIGQVGPAPKVPITETGWAFYGMESSSILEPVMKLYHWTGYKRYLDFAKYIIEDAGGCARENLFEAAYSGKYPMDIGSNGIPEESVAKAYEMMSCFEGLMEYYRATGEEKWKEAVLRFYGNLVDQEVTIIGSGGADKPHNLGPGTGEQWNRTKFEQTNPDIHLMQETCVTVTWMKLCLQLLRMTADPAVADELEKSVYNALLGAAKPEGNYFEYFPKLNGTRDAQVNFSYDIDGFPLSCCTANGPMGLVLLPFVAAMKDEEGPFIQLYLAGEYQIELAEGQKLAWTIETTYPVEGTIRLKITQAPDNGLIVPFRLRIPAWSLHSSLHVNEGKAYSAQKGTYREIRRQWSQGDVIRLELDMTGRIVTAPHGSNRAGDPFIALLRGPLVLSRDARVGGDIQARVDIPSDAEGRVELRAVPPTTARIAAQFVVPSKEGEFQVVDYASAGSTWDEKSEFRTWMPI
ncbi:MAG: hypothetical protein K0R57_1858 [Paenibacillaceae bacterium]|jgi:DUF1680 family protein|nr:hypothetical protein [Paenibacillaceae bacterium]